MKKTIYLFSISSHPNAININPLSLNFFPPKIDFSQYDNFIITSKQIAKILNFYGVKKEYLKPALCISKQSAKSYEAIGGSVFALGKGYGDTLVEIIKRYPKEKNWLYLRAEVVASDFVEICRKDGYNIDEAVLYESKCSHQLEKIDLEKDATLVFTSPSSVKCFLTHHTILQTQSVVVIGKTTQRALPKGIVSTVAKEKSIENCMQIAQSL